MTQRRWPFAVHDARARTYRGSVAYTTDTDSPIVPPDAPLRFHILLLSSPARVRTTPDRTAVCIPGIPRMRPIGAPIPVPSLPAKISELWLPPRLMAAYRCGRVVTPAKRIIRTDDVFPAHTDRPRLDLLALALVAVDTAETLAPYTALIRHELKLRAPADALAALEALLTPTDARSRPPRRAPGIVRLRHAVQRLRQGLAPDVTFSQFADDLRFLTLFEDSPMSSAAVAALLTDVRRSAPASSATRKQRAAGVRVAGFRRGREQT